MSAQQQGNTQQWWLSKKGTPTGPYDAAFILDGLRTGKIPPDTFACLVGGSTWKKLCESATFAGACSSAIMPPPLPPDAAGPASMGVGYRQRTQVVPQSPKLIAKYNLLSFAWGVPGIIIQSGAMFWRNIQGATAPPSESTSALIGLGGLVGSALLITGLAYYAMAKGRHWAWGFMGLLSWIGLIVLACLKNRNPTDTWSARCGESR